MMSRAESNESLTAKLLVARQSDADEADDGRDQRTDLLIRGLVERLPKPSSVWPIDERAK